MQKVLSCFTCIEGLSLFYVKVLKVKTPLQKLNCKPILVAFRDSLSRNQESCMWSVPLSLNWSKQEMSVLRGARCVPHCSIPSRAVLPKAELLEQRVLNKTRNTTLCWRVALPEKSVCFCEIEIRTLSFFCAAWVGFWVGRVWDTGALGTAFYRHGSKPETWY